MTHGARPTLIETCDVRPGVHSLRGSTQCHFSGPCLCGCNQFCEDRHQSIRINRLREVSIESCSYCAVAILRACERCHGDRGYPGSPLFLLDLTNAGEKFVAVFLRHSDVREVRDLLNQRDDPAPK
jgi:hypothetical protein